MSKVGYFNQRIGADMNDKAPAPDRLLQFFTYVHLPERLRDVSRPFCDLAHTLAATLPPGPERTVALRKLLESKDCAVRAALEAQA